MGCLLDIVLTTEINAYYKALYLCTSYAVAACMHQLNCELG